ncbi:MAG: hypothetical protein F6J94_30780 [Moorea sp. SIO1F2]|uniref:hypothetical protein n=1 Tax=unclassified Moorena TaxID=2683338 RepID=UPI0013B8E8FB|nr:MULTISPECIES: hypothetical protein [unclassified Moorena]NEO22194.1 hypothetical protein [Moorena sp. SIO4A5]NEQ56690.1 hypothetical protein [Moorena sp. SIO4A1]NET86104.1 hypothetical protein [Moorena sp. SIO1F2]
MINSLLPERSAIQFNYIPKINKSAIAILRLIHEIHIIFTTPPSRLPTPDSLLPAP